MLIQVIKSHSDLQDLGIELDGAGYPRANEAINPMPAPVSGPTVITKASCNHASPIPLYSQIRELLRGRISDGTYCADGKMPSENEMVRAFGVSRITVRQALNDLQKEGLIFKIHGKGTFVAKPKAVQNLMRLEGFGEAMSAAGHDTHSQVLGHRVMRPGRHVASRLGLDEKVEVMEIQRVRYLNGVPISLDVTYVPVDIGRRLIKEDLPRRDVFLILEQDYGFNLDRAELRIEAMLADTTLAQALAVSEGSPVLRIERLTIALPERPIDFEYLYYRGDAFQYFMMVGRRSGPANRTPSHSSGGTQ